jgi:transcriptional regulator with XRE-family HTH domain
VQKSIYSDEYERLTLVLREMRKEAGLTQVEVADLLSVPQSFISKYEAGQRRLDLIEVSRVALALGSTLHAILKRLDIR